MNVDDDATRREEADRERALKHRKPAPKHTGFCLNCGEPVERGSFCPGGECREDYELARRA